MASDSNQKTPSSSRKLVAILFVDVVGYSKLMHEDEKAALVILKRYQTVLAAEVEKEGGRAIKNYGDGSLCIFKSAVHALRAAKEIQIQFRNDPIVPARIGLHTGDIIEKDGDIYGDGVNIASRLESMGKAGTVQFSRSIFDKVRNHKEFTIAKLGKFELKNISDPVEVFALADEGFSVLTSKELKSDKSKPINESRPRLIKKLIPYILLALAIAGMKLWNDFTKSTKIVEKSIAVLPFNNESADASNDYFCNGIMEDILIQLQAIGDLTVISRTSVIPYKNSNKPIREIAKELNVAYILEGSVRKSGNQVKVTTNLIDGVTESQQWAGSYNPELTAKNLFDIQNKIANGIAKELQAVISPNEQKVLDDAPTDNLDAYDEYLRGLYFYHNRFGGGEDFIFNAIEKFESAIAQDPNFAKAHLRLAYSHDHVYYSNIDGTASRAKLAKEHFEQAQRLDRNDPEIKEGQGWYHYHISADYEKAREIFSDLSINYPRLSTPLNGLGVVQGRLGQWADAEKSFEQSISLDPSYTSTHLNYYYVLIAQRKFVEAKSQLDWMLNISPENIRAHVEMTNLYLYTTGDVNGAVDYYDKSRIDDKQQSNKLKIYNRDFEGLLSQAIGDMESWSELKDRAIASFLLGQQDQSKSFAEQAASILEAYIVKAPNDHRAKTQLGIIHALAGNGDKAIAIAQSAMTAMSIEKDARLGPDLLFDYAQINCILGDKIAAINSLTELLSINSLVTPELLNADPIWDSIREESGFKSLVSI